MAGHSIGNSKMPSRKFSLHHRWVRHATIGFLGATRPAAWSTFVTAFDMRLHELGWNDGGNIDIDYQWAEGRNDLYAKHLKRFVANDVDVIVTSGTPAVLAAKKATK